MSEVGYKPKKNSDRSARSIVLYLILKIVVPPVIVMVSLSTLTSNYILPPKNFGRPQSAVWLVATCLAV